MCTNETFNILAVDTKSYTCIASRSLNTVHVKLKYWFFGACVCGGRGELFLVVSIAKILLKMKKKYLLNFPLYKHVRKKYSKLLDMNILACLLNPYSLVSAKQTCL